MIPAFPLSVISAKTKMKRSLRTSNRKLPTRVLILLVATVALLVAYVTFPAGQWPTASSRPLGAKEPFQVLVEALATWDEGDAPPAVVKAAAACTPRDATEAILHMLSEELRSQIVLDVGANKGWPVSSLALKYMVGVLLSIEPDSRNFRHLTRLPVPQGTIYIPVKGALSDKPGKMDMAFHSERDDFTCFNCLNTSRDEVTTESVSVKTVDGLILDGAAGQQVDGELAVALLKTDTQGHETAVLRGANRLLKSGRVIFIIMEFDPKLLRTKENALEAMNLLFESGMHCVHLTFAMVPEQDRANGKWPEFGEPVSRQTAERFLEFVKKEDKYTDLFCGRKTFS